jgi:fucose permease
MGGFAAFALLGGLQALYGPAIPQLHRTFHVPVSTAGLIVSAHFAGAIAGILLTGAVTYRISPGYRLAGALLLVAVGALFLAKAPFWPVPLVGALLLGFGFGVLVLDLNTLFASGFGARSAAMITLLNAAYGTGALMGPLALGLLFAARVQGPFLVGSVAALCLMPVLSIRQNRPRPLLAATPTLSTRSVLPIFILMLALYEGIEADIGGWEATQLTFHGFSASAAATMTALFWGGLTAGRLLTAALSLRFRPQQLLVVSVAVLIVLLFLAHILALLPVTYVLCGGCCAVILPLGFVWLQEVLPGSAGAGSLTLAGALVGATLFPLLVGRWIALTTPDILPTALLLLAILCFLTVLWLRVMTRARRDALVEAGR